MRHFSSFLNQIIQHKKNKNHNDTWLNYFHIRYENETENEVDDDDDDQVFITYSKIGEWKMRKREKSVEMKMTEAVWNGFWNVSAACVGS
jgi:hypothetical protein